MTETEPTGPTVVGDKSELVRRISSAPGVLVGFDFDGTLAPIESNPTHSTVAPSLAERLQEFANRPNVQLAVVSGRQLADLESRIPLDDTILAGNHGLEVKRDNEYTVYGDADEYRSLLESIAETLSEKLAEIPGCRIEDKEFTRTIHVRETPDSSVDAVCNTVQRTVERYSNCHITRGKQAFEVRPSVSHDKGTTMAMLAKETPADWLTLYIGDDTTDEHAFEVIQPDGVGVHIGANTETEALYRVPEQDDVESFVNWLEEMVSAEDS